jgi:GTPase SAR1 family protein
MCVSRAGNKCDRKNQRQVTLLEASRLAQENGLSGSGVSRRRGMSAACVYVALERLKQGVRGNCSLTACAGCEIDMLFMETSAVTGECVDDVFVKCASSILNKIEGGE